MALKDLEQDEITIIGKALRLLSEAQLIGDFEFGTRIGVKPDEFRKLLHLWPNWDDTDDNSSECLVVNNTLNDILYGIGVSDHDLRESIGLDRAELEKVYRKWSKSRGWNATGIR